MSEPILESYKVNQGPDKTQNIPNLGEPLSAEERLDVVRPAGGYVANHDQKYLQKLAFMEEPITVVINGNSTHDEATVTDFVAVNGKQAQILVNGQWANCPYLPKMREVIIRRKYVDVLLRQKSEKVKTNVLRLGDGDTINQLNRTMHLNSSVSLIKDDNPNGTEWFKRAVASTY